MLLVAECHFYRILYFLKLFAGHTGPSSEEAELDSVHDVVKVVHVDDEILRELSLAQSRIDQVNFHGLNPFTDKFGKLKLNKKKKNGKYFLSYRQNLLSMIPT